MSFLQEYQSLIDNLPRIGTDKGDVDPKDLTFECSYTKNSYHSTFLSKCVDNYYCHRNISCDNCFDCSNCGGLMNSYMCYYCRDSSELVNCKYCLDCSGLYNCFLCHGCKNCFGCYGLRKMEYCIFNQQFSKESYERRLAEVRAMSQEEVNKIMDKMYDRIGILGKIDVGDASTDSVFTSGGMDNESCYYCFGTYQSNNSAYCYDCESAKDCYDNYISTKCELCYECVYSFLSYECFYCYGIKGCSRSSYLYECNDCIDCFGCVGIRKKQYCILNKQYDKDSYEREVVKIKQEL